MQNADGRTTSEGSSSASLTCRQVGGGSMALAAFAMLLILGRVPATSQDLAARCANRTAIERIYYTHRLGDKPPFEQVSSPALIERLVRQDLAKEAALQNAYGVVLTPAIVQAEVQRINTTTRAPDVLAEIKAALGNDRAKFANSFAQPILVDRLLRDKFDNDDRLHAPQRKTVEQLRASLLAAATTNTDPQSLLGLMKDDPGGQVSEATWQLGTPPAQRAPEQSRQALEIQRRFGPNAQLLSSPGRREDRRFYFEELPSELRNVLRAQLRQPGNVSAVLELPGTFALYLATQKTDETLSVATFWIKKRSFEDWLAAQTHARP